MSMDEFIKTLTSEQKQALLNALTDKDNTHSDTEPKTEREEVPKSIQNSFIVDSKKPSPNNRRREAVKARKNDWVDTGEDRHIETKYGARTPRNRESHKKMDVECSVCGRSFKADPRYVYGEYHRCNRCVGK
jgi:hypothetical protein